jgi:hypothetical protein
MDVSAPNAATACVMFAPAERRSMTGFWKTMAWRRGWRQEAVAEAQQERLARAVRSEDHRRRRSLEAHGHAVKKALSLRLEDKSFDAQRQNGRGLGHRAHPA